MTSPESLGYRFEIIVKGVRAQCKLTGPIPPSWIEWHNTFVAAFVEVRGTTVGNLRQQKELLRECVTLEKKQFWRWLKEQVTQAMGEEPEPDDLWQEEKQFFVVVSRFDPQMREEIDATRERIDAIITRLYNDG